MDGSAGLKAVFTDSLRGISSDLNKGHILTASIYRYAREAWSLSGFGTGRHLFTLREMPSTVRVL